MKMGLLQLPEFYILHIAFYPVDVCWHDLYKKHEQPNIYCYCPEVKNGYPYISIGNIKNVPDLFIS